MDNDQSQPATSTPTPSAEKKLPLQAIAGLTPPSIGESRVRETWPVLSAVSPLGKIAEKCVNTIFLAPLGWLLFAPVFGLRFAPFICRRYTLTNRRMMIQKGLNPSPAEEIALADIDEVRVVEGSVDDFYHYGDLEIVSGGEVKLKLAGVPEPEGFRRAILNTVSAWVPGKSSLHGPFVAAK